MKKVPLTTCENGKLVISGEATIETSGDNVYLVGIDVYPGSTLARQLSVRGVGAFSIDLKNDPEESTNV